MIDSINDYVYINSKVNINNKAIQHSCERLNKVICANFSGTENVSEVTAQSTTTTMLYKEYNIFLYPYKGFYSLFKEIRDMFNYIAKPTSPHYLQAWLNVYQKGEFIDWHGHWYEQHNVWHGYYCVDVETEPSSTMYMIPGLDKILNIPSRNQLLVMGKSSNDKHRSSEWNSNHPRVTIGFDIIPGIEIEKTQLINHYIPL